jgi:hypothetical protein
MRAKKIALPEVFAPAGLVREVKALIQSARLAASTTVNTLQVFANFEIGRRIVEHEQKGKARADYGKALLRGLSQALTADFGAGFSERNLLLFRRFYLEYASRTRTISQTVSAESSPTRPTFSLSWSLPTKEVLKERLDAWVREAEGRTDPFEAREDAPSPRAATPSVRRRALQGGAA